MARSEAASPAVQMAENLAGAQEKQEAEKEPGQEETPTECDAAAELPEGAGAPDLTGLTEGLPA
eukprot:10270551-Lingulodinium_polyedra.AAC.1